jgi:predicted nucleic acid-binding protein
MIYADASFVIALFVIGDDHWHKAWQWWRQNQGPTILVSRLTLFEAENSIRGLGASKQCRPSAVRASIEGIKRAHLEGVLVRRNVPEHRLYPQAVRLSQYHTVSCTFGALDIVHVAIALDLRVETLLSFDERQRELAMAEGLSVQPM